MTHRVGIIGLGTVGVRFVEQFARHTAFDLVAAWDPDAAACDAQRDAVDIAADADAVIAASDLVYIAVPPLAHRDYVERCVAAGVGIFCEKPLGVDVAESRQLVDLVTASGLPAGINFVFSAAPAAVGLTTIVENGSLGDIVRGDLRLHFAQWPRAWHSKAQWLRLRDQGGWLREVASHFLFLAGRVLGPLHLDAGIVQFLDGPDGELCETQAAARLHSATSSLSVVGTSEGVGPDIVDFTVRGTDRSVRITDWYRLETTEGDEWHAPVGDTLPALATNPYTAQLDELAAMMAGEPNRIATFPEALAVQELVEAILVT